MQFNLVNPDNYFSTDILFDETLMALAENGPQASIWRTNQCLVVPRTYKRFNNFEQTCADFKNIGYPVYVRNSGGGVVPQGPGIINVSLSYKVDGLPLDNSDNAYMVLCNLLSKVANKYGVKTKAAPVLGSFCDGRFNLAYVDENKKPTKIAGTAQIWRKNIVLVHALFMVACNIKKITQIANQLEQRLNHDKQYLENSCVSLHSICKNNDMNNKDFENQIIKDLKETILISKLVL